jgi:general secretion pathway protein G
MPGRLRRWLSRSSPGYTFIELIVATAVMMVLASAALPLARVSIRRQREMQLHVELRTMRQAIDRYKDMADLGAISTFDSRLGCENYPASLDILVEGVQRANTPATIKVKFLRRIPIDPVTGQAEWGMRSLSDPPDSKIWSGQCVFDVYSKAEGKGLDGTNFRDW